MDFTPEMYRSAKLRKYYGVTLFVPVARAQAHIQKLKGDPYYMPNKRIAELAGVCESNLCQIFRGHRSEARNFEVIKEIHRATEAAILGVRPEIDPPERGGGHVPPEGARRRLQALVAAGFPMRYLSEGMGWGADPQPVHRFITGKAGVQFVQHSTHLKVYRLFQKLDGVRPEDMDFTALAIKRAKTSALRQGYAPAWCWDEDTIGDPDAHPEWTGACGTEEGYRIHIRETLFNDNPMPVCVLCRAAGEPEVPVQERIVFHRVRFAELLKAKGVSVRRLCRDTGLRHDSVYRWKLGDYSPKFRGDVETMAAYFGVSAEELMTTEAVPLKAGQAPKKGQFNRHVLRVALDLKGVSINKAAGAAGVSHRAVSNWLNGVKLPEGPERIKPIAKFLGVGVEVFYG